jgi:uncharacterized DUF497 family protein
VIFEWDPKKAAKNLKKHGVTFQEAATVFGDPLAITFQDPDHSDDEERQLTFGFTTVPTFPLMIPGNPLRICV